MINQENQCQPFTVYMPNGKPIPEVLTEDELITLLRLDQDGPAKARLTIRYYRKKGLLRGVRLGKTIRYSRTEVLKFIEEQTQWTNRKNSA